MKVSQPKPRETIQMNRVLQVSMVDREVALTLRVTDKPKKLKPLVAMSVFGYPDLIDGILTQC